MSASIPLFSCAQPCLGTLFLSLRCCFVSLAHSRVFSGDLCVPAIFPLPCTASFFSSSISRSLSFFLILVLFLSRSPSLAFFLSLFHSVCPCLCLCVFPTLAWPPPHSFSSLRPFQLPQGIAVMDILCSKRRILRIVNKYCCILVWVCIPILLR